MQARAIIKYKYLVQIRGIDELINQAQFLDKSTKELE